MNDAVIVDVIRSGSGKGKPGGGLSGVHPVDLLAEVLAQLVARNGLDPVLVDDVIGGCVSQVGEQTLNLTRNALLAAGFPESVPAATIDRQCGSSQQAVAFAAQSIMAGTNDIVIACGVESMSRIPINAAFVGMNPYGEKLKQRYPDGLVGQGISAELIVAKWGLSREQLDDFSANSHAKAAAAWARGDFANEVVAVGDFATDETVRPSTTAEGLAGLGSAFRDPKFEARFPDLRWAITAGNSSPLTDGASAALIMSADKAKELGMTPRARIHTLVAVGSDPLYMLTGVLPATEKVLKRSGLGLGDIDVFEVNEAFAPVPLVWLKETGADPAKLNVRGGAIALGHPLGASGTKLLATMLNALEASGGRYGLQTMCEGGGMANATIIERI